jgi:hypothetical protein
MKTEEILEKLAEMRRKIPHLSHRPRPEKKSLVEARTVEEFESAAVIDALETLAEDVRETIKDAERRMYESALDIYYAAEELARDPAHPEMIPQVEAMRAAHQKSYGFPIPTKDETARRREKEKRESADGEAP